MTEYDSSYYEGNEQSSDRPALGYYYRFFKHQLSKTTGRPQVLEYGCGVGHLTKRLVRDFDTYALDISDYALEQVNKNAPKAKTIKAMDGVRQGSLDGIIALHVMEHIENPSLTFREFHDKLKPGGLLVYVVPNPEGLGHSLKKEKWFGFSDKSHVSLFGEQKWIKLTSEGGFDVEKAHGDGMWDVPYFSGVPTTLQKLIFFPPIVPQFIAGTAFLPTKLGECLIIVAHKG